MKYIILCVIAVFSAVSAISQTNQNDVIKVYLGEQKFEILEQEAPEKLQFYFLLDEQGYSVENIAPKPTVDFQDALLVQGINDEVEPITAEMLLSGEFHGLLYNFERKFDQTVYYQIGGAEGMVLIVHPTRYIQRLFEEQ
ncbi:MAG: hypothetical protein ACI80P_000683 [Flavobacteriales bacterium]|jgi:hypothetical protein